MEFGLSESQEMLKDMAREFLEGKCTSLALKEWEAGSSGFSADVYKEMADLGLLGVTIPEVYGGSEGSLIDLAVVVEECGRAALPGPFFSTVVYGALPLQDGGSEEQKSELLPRIASGELVFSAAFAEPEVHYDMREVAAVAAGDNEGYSLTGTKLFVPYAQEADYLLTLARTEVGTEGLSLFLVKGGAAGMRPSVLLTTGTERLYEVEFQKVSLSNGDVLGNVNNGWLLTQRTQLRATALRCVEMVGMFERALELTTEHVKNRVAFGRLIGSFQAVQHRLADMYNLIHGARLAAYQGIWRLDSGLPAEREVAIAKAFVSDVSQTITVGAHQLHGGMGVDMDYPLQYLHRRVKTLDLDSGPAAVQRERLAQVLNLSKTGNLHWYCH